MGGAIGLLLGGALTELLDWRWCLYVSVVFALPAALVASRLLRHVPVANRARLDVRGALLASAGLFALVFGLSQAQTDGWGDATTVPRWRSPPCCSPASSRSRPGRHNRCSRCASSPTATAAPPSWRSASASAGLFALFLFLTFYLQVTKGFSAFETGLAFLPMSLSIAPTVGVVTTKILPRTGPRPLVPTGMLVGAVGMLLLTRWSRTARTPHTCCPR